MSEPTQALIPATPSAPGLPDRPWDEKTASLAELKAVATTFAMSEMFKDCDSAAKCLAKMFVARDLGLSMTRGLLDIHMISGKPTLSANLIAGMIKKSGKYDYRITEHNPKVCRMNCLQRIDGAWEIIGPSEFTIEDAQTAGLLSNPTWKKFPKNMLFSRAISNAAKQYFGDVFLGSVYTPDELDTTVEYDGDGNVVSPAQKFAKIPARPTPPPVVTFTKLSGVVDSPADVVPAPLAETEESLRRDCTDLVAAVDFPIADYLKENKIKSLADMDIGGLRNFRNLLKLRLESSK